jgi:hypothetical protein
LTSSREKNLVNQAAVFCVKNALKLTSDHLRLEKNFRGLYPRTPEGKGKGRGEKKGEDRGGKEEEREGKEGEGLQPLQKCLSVLAPVKMDRYKKNLLHSCISVPAVFSVSL